MVERCERESSTTRSDPCFIRYSRSCRACKLNITMSEKTNKPEQQIMVCLVDLPPLASLLFHKLRVDARHDLVKLLATR
jgi:hypothetical protein